MTVTASRLPNFSGIHSDYQRSQMGRYDFRQGQNNWESFVIDEPGIIGGTPPFLPGGIGGWGNIKNFWSVLKNARSFFNAAKGGSNIAIQFGKTENKIYHTFRHTDALGLNRSLVQSTVQNHFKTVSSQVVSEKPFNQIIEIGG